MKKLICYSLYLGVLCFGFLILNEPKICVDGAINGLLICGRVIIPSLYPFTFCVLFILTSDVLNNLRFLNLFFKKIFGLNAPMFAVFLLSLVGGYPLGAKMLDSSTTNPKNASIMLNYCVNAGPAFIILAVGEGIFHSQKIGILLFLCHILPSVLFALLLRKKMNTNTNKKELKKVNSIDNFVLSASNSAATLFNICAFVLLFSVITSYFNYFEKFLPFLRFISPFLEVTNGISSTKNIFFISFLLGFGGLSIWCQVFSLCKRFKVNILQFGFFRFLHGGFSAVLTFFGIKIFKISIPTLSNGKPFTFSPFFDSFAISISLISMVLVLLISLSTKKYAGNIIEDLV